MLYNDTPTYRVVIQVLTIRAGAQESVWRSGASVLIQERA
jgi:hypothetical protein